MKHFLRDAVAWLSVSAPSRFLPRDDATVAAPASAQSEPSFQKFFVNGSSTFVPPPSTNLATVIYTMSNANGAANQILAYNLNSKGSSPNGMINGSAPVVTKNTGGNGLRFNFTGSTFQDALDSQGSLIQVGARLFAVNAGSNTVSVFAINCTNPTQLFPYGKPVATSGNNPSTIAVAIANHIFCVATTGTNSAIECYTFSAGFGSLDPPQPISGGTVSLPLPVAQSSPPVGPADTVSQLLFTDDEKYLIAVVKSQVDSTGKVLKSGYINVYPLTSSGLGTPVTSKPPGAALLFGCTLNFDTYNLLCTDAGGAVVFLTSQSDLTYKVTLSNPTASIGNGTNCWATRSPFKNAPLYASPVDKNYIASFQNSNGGYLATTNFATSNMIGGSNPQIVELQAANNYIYGLSFGTKTIGQHILVTQDINLDGEVNSVQNFQLSGVTNAVSGLALFIPGDEPNICDFK